jgi:ribonuclease HI
VNEEFTMAATVPHYLMLTTCESKPVGGGTTVVGQWRFVLEALDADDRLDIRDCEPKVSGERLELLAVLRGLEALDQPSRVTMVTPSRYVIRGIRFGLETWKQNNWQWENHGEMVAVKDHDLWQRLDLAMQIHDIRLRHWNAEVGQDRRLPDQSITAHHDEYATAVAG